MSFREPRITPHYWDTGFYCMRWSCIRCGKSGSILPDDSTPLRGVRQKDFRLRNGDYLRVNLGDICEDCMSKQPDTSNADVAKPVMHSLEYFRRKQAGEDLEGVIVNDCVPQKGVFDTHYLPYMEWENKTIMVEVAQATVKTVQKRGVNLQYLQLERAGIKMAWQGDGLGVQIAERKAPDEEDEGSD